MSDQLIIAGFHRSGTSATAQILNRAGLFLGYELLEALPSNPYGHFEDKEVVSFHNQLLADNHQSWIVSEPFLPVVAQLHWERMQQMIERRSTEHRLWGFKDPRVCLFLALWKYLLPNAKVLIVYRHFSNSTYSLAQRHSSDLFLKRGSEYTHRRFWREPDLALRMWLVHNKGLLAFARAYPKDTMTVSIDMIRDGFPFVWALNRRWNLGLDEVPVAEAFDRTLTAGQPANHPVPARRLIGKVTAPCGGRGGLSGKTERLIEKRAAVVRE